MAKKLKLSIVEAALLVVAENAAQAAVHKFYARLSLQERFAIKHDPKVMIIEWRIKQKLKL